MKHLTAGLLGLMLIGLSACGSDPEPETAAAPPPQTEGAAPQPAPPQTAADEDMTAKLSQMARAVGNGKPGAAVDIRYEFKGKPTIGAPIELDLALVPSAGVDSMDATVSGMDGVSLTGPLTASFADVVPGKPYTHNVTVLPERNGVYYITVVIRTQIGGSSLGRTYAIPFAAGNVQTSEKPKPAKDAHGQAIQSLPAQESSG